ncbi:MAG: hypothetical protein HYT30_00880 [Parcubacteria group bacterium]|nr:hypothetical protein [Parcubacteria group bacterium]
MAHILAKLEHANVENVKKALRQDSWKHAREGISLEHVWTNADAPHEVQFLFEANNLEHARAFIAEVHERARAEHPDAQLPSMTFFETHDDPEFDIELPEKEEGEENKKESSEDSSATNTAQTTQSVWKVVALSAGGLVIGVTIGINSASCPVLECPANSNPSPAPQANVSVPRQVPTTPVKTETATAVVESPRASSTPDVAAPTTPESPVEEPAAEGAQDGSAGL